MSAFHCSTAHIAENAYKKSSLAQNLSNLSLLYSTTYNLAAVSVKITNM